MYMKIALIVDKSQPYLDFQRDRIFTQWNVDDFDHVKSFSEVGEATIFGEPPASAIFLNDINSVKKIYEDLAQAEKSNILESRLSQGLIMTTTVARVSTKKLESFIKDNGGIVVFAKENSKDKTNVTDKLLNETSLNREVKKFLSEYIGDDYETLVSLLRNISVLSPKQQNKLEVEDMFIRLPQSPGSVAPWEIEKPLMSGDANSTIELYRRISQHSHYLVVLSILKNKIQLSWRIASLLSIDSRMSLADSASALGVANNYPFKLATENAKKLGLNKLEYCLSVIADTEADVKGGSSADGNVIMEITLMKILNKLRG